MQLPLYVGNSLRLSFMLGGRAYVSSCLHAIYFGKVSTDNLPVYHRLNCRIVRGECKSGLQDLHYLPSPNSQCLPRVNATWPTVQKCQNRLPFEWQVWSRCMHAIPSRLTIFNVASIDSDSNGCHNNWDATRGTYLLLEEASET